MYPLLSVIVPIYNVEKYLVSCVQSLVSQTYKNIEIILVNDGSPDGCGDICEKFKAQDTRIRVIHKKNEGLVRARKSGLEASNGEYIGFVDGDDWIEPRMFEELMLHAIRDDVDIIAAGHKEELHGNVTEILFNSLPLGLYTKDKLIKDVYPYMICTGPFSDFGIFSYLWSKVFRRSVLIPNQMAVDDEIVMAEDAACTYPALLSANSLFITDSNCYHYRQRIDSMVKSRDLDIKELKRYQNLYDFLYKRFHDTPYSDLLIPQLNMLLLSLLTVRSGLDFESSGNLNELFAFGAVPYGSKVVICGAGTFGQHLVRRIKYNRNFNMVLWVDPLHKLYRESGMPVMSMQDVKNINFDYIIIAYISEKYSENMRVKLIGNGVQTEKILLVNHFVKYPIEDLLKRFGINIFI
jgi:glycosyltransferase involved in cell wall biosynthesis